MKRRFLALALVTAAAAALLVGPGAGAAAAAPPPRMTCPGLSSLAAGRVPYLNTPYGALALCYQQASNGRQGRIGYFSPYLNRFVPQSGWLNEHRSAACPCGTVVNARWGGNENGPMVGNRAVMTPFGPANFGIQFQDSSLRKGRFGNRNLATGIFYPSTTWFEVKFFGTDVRPRFGLDPGI